MCNIMFDIFALDKTKDFLMKSLEFREKITTFAEIIKYTIKTYGYKNSCCIS